MTMASETLNPRRVIEDAAGEWGRGEKRPDWLRRAAREIGLSFSVVVALWYGKRKRLVDREYIALSRTAATIQERRARLVALHDQIRAARTVEHPDVDIGAVDCPGGKDRAAE